MRPVKRIAVLLLLVVRVIGGCSGSSGGESTTGTTESPPASVLPGRYVEELFSATTETKDVVYATAPDLRSGVMVPLTLDLFEPVGDESTERPAIVWVHGGGFFQGSKRDITTVAEAYARRGYVTVSIDYRLLPGNRCQDVQRKTLSAAELAAAAAGCEHAMGAAQHDAQAAVRWMRATATALGVDPDRIAIAGFSAGAITAVRVAQRSDDAGDVGAHPGVSSTVGAGLAASGCNTDLNTIDSADAPIHLVASEKDAAVFFSCVTTTEQRTRAVGGTVETLYFRGEGTHALQLYNKHQAAVDAAWTGFLRSVLDLP